MPKQSGPSTTQRAYTLRLRGLDANDASWREALWKTHEAVNNGARVFGNWLLTLRGGLDHKLADSKPEDRKSRRILLALSWLSVESKIGAPEKYIIAAGDEKAEVRTPKVVRALREILERRGLSGNEISGWVEDCRSSLSAAIREDAVWVDRSKAFDEICKNKNGARKDAEVLFEYLLTSNYLSMPKIPDSDEKDRDLPNQEGVIEKGEEDKDQEDKQSGEGAGQRTRHPYSHIFGRETTDGFGKPKRSLQQRQSWRELLTEMLKDAGIPLVETRMKGKKCDTSSPSELYREMFSKAASRLAQIWTKQKQQEAARQIREKSDEALKRMEADVAYLRAMESLNEYRKDRGRATGSFEEYQITIRAVEGWEKIVAVWDKIQEDDSRKSEEKRIDAVKRLQNEDDETKFGDVNLFIALASPKYEAIWRHKGCADASILKIYVKGLKARADAVRLKIAAFRHPDPYFHPEYCRFGVSRPHIEFARLKENGEDVRAVRMLLWTGQEAKRTKLYAVSKRFDDEIGSRNNTRGQNLSTAGFLVARRNRHGIAAVAESSDDGMCCVAHVFDKQQVRNRKNRTGDSQTKNPEWNGTLWADRRALEKIGRLQKKNREMAEQAKRRLKWWLIVSLELRSMGPWYGYIEQSSDKSPFTRAYKSGSQKGKEYIDSNGWPHEREKKKRGTNAQLILSRLPGLRVLSVDLGHRHAAACAVWEAVGASQVEKACQAAKQEKPGPDALYLHLENEKGRTIIYRRIGADKLPDGKTHPAPWARLDRQFLIKLQGEEGETREASCGEMAAVHRLEKELGRSVPLVDRLVAAGWGATDRQRKRLEELKRMGCVPSSAEKTAATSGTEVEEESGGNRPSLEVGELMFSAVTILRWGLKRHGDRARIAHYLVAETKTQPGDKKEILDENGRIELVRDALDLWRDLFSSPGWRDDAAEKLWNERIARLPGCETADKTRGDSAATEGRKGRKKDPDRFRETAKALAADAALRQSLHEIWKKRWEEEDGQWRKRLRWFKDWILPRGKKGDDPAIRKVGGLSLTRLATLTEFRRKVQVAFFTRLQPEGKKDKAGEAFGQRALDALEDLRDQRVKQLASRIAEAALGIGRVKRPEGGRDPRRPDARVDEPCHAVVVENLTHYRPEETRTRRENRQLMDWSSSKVKKYLEEACQLHGLHFREVQAGYTSRQDSRTGAPGIRCQDVAVYEYMRSPFWRKQVKTAVESLSGGKGDARERYLVSIDERWKDKSQNDWKKAGTVRIPFRGGEIFVSADPKSPAARGIQADLNAAANIGLKALTDPDWPGRWWYVPCDPSSFKPKKEKVEGSAAVKPDLALRQASPTGEGDAARPKRGSKGSGKGKETVNLWRDVSSSPIGPSGEWKEYAAYQNEVQYRVVRNLEKRLK